MLPARARLRRSSEFTAAVRRGPGTVRVGRSTLVLHARGPATATASEGANPPGPSDAVPARAGLVVSRAVGPAVVRNRVKRRLRHLLRGRLDQLPAGLVLVVRANPAAAGATSAELGADLDGALRVLTRRLRDEPS
ncbi:MAG TPA: ribonuclease P protein component [Motilibacteraceae bacterium]|nr:ribonuclease P protein component [Motilibacteraceae bacterium]